MARISELERAIVNRWLTTHRADILGPSLDHAHPVDDTPFFNEVLAAIDDAERDVWATAAGIPPGN